MGGRQHSTSQKGVHDSGHRSANSPNTTSMAATSSSTTATSSSPSSSPSSYLLRRGGLQLLLQELWCGGSC